MIRSAEQRLKETPSMRSSTFAWLTVRDRTIAKLQSEIEAEVDRQIAAAFRLFPFNVWRAYCAGRL